LGGIILKEFKATVLSFGAPWCHEWYLLTEELTAIEKELRTPVKFIHIDVEKCPHLASKYEIEELPTIVIIQNGKIKKVLPLFQKRENIFDEIKKVL
jgi:thioredoxin 1